MKTKRYDAIDAAKWIMAWMVVSIHLRPLKEFSLTADILTNQGLFRIAAPFYFAVSGFLLFGKIQDTPEAKGQNRKILGRYLKQIAVLYLTWAAVYAGYKLGLEIYEKGLTREYVLQALWNFFLKSPQIHLWYLLAMLFAIPAVYCLRKLPSPAMAALILLLTFGQNIRVTYQWEFITRYPLLCEPDDTVFPRTVFMAIPQLCIGILCLRDYQKYPAARWLRRLCVAAAVYVAELAALYAIYGNGLRAEVLLSGPALVYCLLCWLLSVNWAFPDKRVAKFLRLSGVWIYCFHQLAQLVYFYIFAYRGWIPLAVVGGCSLITSLMYAAVKMWPELKGTKHGTIRH